MPVVVDTTSQTDQTWERAEVVSRRLAAVAEPTRLRLVLVLRSEGEMSVNDLAKAVDGSLPNVSKHLRILHEAGLVTREKAGTRVQYALANDGVGTLIYYAVRVLGGLRRSRS